MLLLASVFYLPWWLSAILTVGGVMMFDQFYEVALAALLFDLLYGLSPGLPLTLLSVVLVFSITALKKNLLIFVRL
ncbi:MAG: hypothetical protein HYT48_01240 [Candidatus Vogelbacteria bacterium]|nr:hypothetical protein [Candidatus Vogelbacteria bacterium]